MADARATHRIKIASASLNQIVYDYATNFKNVRSAIDLAVDDHADVLSTQELSGTGYEADDYHQWNKNNDDVWALLTAIARYAEEKDPNLVVTVGAPWHYADKTKPANDPAYNINNRPFNTHAVITGGRVIGLSAKSILADGPAEYEPRQFNNWPLSKGTIMVPLPDGTEVPFGKPVFSLGDGKRRISLIHEICAEGWPGLHDDLTIDVREQSEARHIVALAEDYDISVALNPSASKPEPAINKEKIRSEGLCITGSRYCGAYVYSNYLGSASGTYAAEGSQIFAQNGKIVQHGQRYSFKDVAYCSAVVEVPEAVRGKPDAFASHAFQAHAAFERTGREASFDLAYANQAIDSNQLSCEEYIRSTALWARDYISKQSWQPQGAVISLSGGRDSAYGAIVITTMIDLDVKENGIEGFFKRFKGLRYKDQVLKNYAQEGEAAAVRALKKNFLTCVYLPTENSSEETRHAAHFLIEGGELADGTKADGIGGSFYVANVQGIFEEAVVAYTGLNLSKVAEENVQEILGSRAAAFLPEEQTLMARAKLLQMVLQYVNAAPGSQPHLPDYITSHRVNPLPTWADPAFDLILQNLQARIRVTPPWSIAAAEGKMSFVTSNETENVLGYSTAAGDSHMGGANLLGGIGKHAVKCSLDYFENRGLIDLAPIRSLHYITNSQPSAELRKTVAGAAPQTDESDLGFNYEQADFISNRMIVGRQTPQEVLPQMQKSGNLFSSSLGSLRDTLVNFAKRWESAQFKRIMGTLAPYLGSNVDPHQSVRTTVLGDHFHTSNARMTLGVLAETVGGPENFQRKFGLSVPEANMAAQFNNDFKFALISWPLPKLLEPQNWQEFDAENRKMLSYAGPSNKIIHRRAMQNVCVPSPAGGQ